METKLEIRNFWKNVYQKTENSIQSTWENTRENYSNEVRDATVTVDQYTFPHQLQEHMDYFLEITPENQYINPMNEPLITTRETKTQTNKMKNKKAPGQNKIQTHCTNR